MNDDILIEKIKYLTSMPHSVLVEHCIYLENENDNYKAQKYITDFISENSIICEKNKEIKRLNNIINLIKNNIDITIQIIKEQPTGNDEWMLDRLDGLKFILKGDKDE